MLFIYWIIKIITTQNKSGLYKNNSLCLTLIYIQDLASINLLPIDMKLRNWKETLCTQFSIFDNFT